MTNNNEAQQKGVEGEKPTSTATDTNNGTTSQGLGPIEVAQATVKRIEEAQKKMEATLAEIQKIEAEKILSGRGERGQKETTEQDKAQNIANEISGAFRKK